MSSADHPITDPHEIARLLALVKGEQAQIIQLPPPSPKAMEDLRRYLEQSIPGLEWIDREQCTYRRPK